MLLQCEITHGVVTQSHPTSPLSRLLVLARRWGISEHGEGVRFAKVRIKDGEMLRNDTASYVFLFH